LPCWPGGKGEQDKACSVAALKALQEHFGSKHHVTVQADIKL
jgi:hypothetical protein